MIAVLARFAEALRAEGVAVSPAELLDAARAAEAVGITHRARFRGAMRVCLSKDRRQRAAFDRVFDRFFVPPPRGRGDRKGEAGGRGARDGTSRGREAGSSSRTGPPREGPPDARSASRRGEIMGNRRAEARDPASELRALVEQARRPGGGRIPPGRLRVVRLRPERTDDPGRAVPSADPRPVHRDLARFMPSEEERALAREIPAIVRELRLRTGRRMRPAKRGRLWARQIFRANVAHAGVPFVLPYRLRRTRRPRVVLLVDVSFSVARAAGFFLWMAAEFVRIGREARVVAFVDRPVDATEAVRKWLAREPERGGATAGTPRPARSRRVPGEGIVVRGRSFQEVLRSLHGLNLDAPSDYGRALHGLLQSHLRPAGRDTVMVVLGDGRTNRFDPIAWTLEEIGRRCRAVVWLVPEPLSRWGTGDSALASYLPCVDVAVEAHDLSGLTRGIAELVRRL